MNNNVLRFLSCLILFSSIFIPSLRAQTPTVRYAFNQKELTDSIFDETGNGYNAKLEGSAEIKRIGEYSFLSIGDQAGYLDMTSKIGPLVSGLSNFTISTYLYIDSTLTLSNAGNFVWTFSNSSDISSSPTGCMFYSAKNSRYAICPTNYSTEQTVNVNAEAGKGAWHHVTYLQNGTTGYVYIDGILKKTATVTMKPSSLGTTKYNYLCKSSYASDQILMNSMLYDFRIYNTSLTSSQISDLAANRLALDTITYTDMVDTELVKLDLGDLSAVTYDLDLPATGTESTNITWSSSDNSIITSSGNVSRPTFGSSNATVTLTATVTKYYISKTKTFVATVLPSLPDDSVTTADSTSLGLSGNLTKLRSSLSLPDSGDEGSTIIWSSSKPDTLSNGGVIVNRPVHGNGDALVVLTATITKGLSVKTKKFDIYVAEDEGFVGYLFAYFTGNDISQEAIRFALSDDGYVFKALNDDEPILASANISSTGGVRDPHILRGENNDYYMVATDMVSANGWNSNRGLILLKSTDLINWEHTAINIPNTYSVYANADRVWAPQTIYDSSVEKYMVYFAMRLGSSDYDKIYYAYVNDDFTAFESTPQLLFDNSGLSTIDADIVYKDGQYHLFFKTEGNGNGIKKAVSSSLTSGYVLYDKYLDCSDNAVEGGCVFRRYNSDNWMLIYDVYSSGYYEFTTSTDLENFSVVANTISFDFTPRHGTIIPITETEKEALTTEWGSSSGITQVENVKMKVSPNPVKDYLEIDVDSLLSSNAMLNLVDLSGRLVYREKIASSNVKLDVSGFQAGNYVLVIYAGGAKIASSHIIVRK